MNRIMVDYTPQKGNIASNLKIYNDIKGLTQEKIGHTFYGRDADIMWQYFKNATIKENSEVMSYGLYVDGKYLDNRDEVVTIDRDMTHFFDGVAELDTTPLLSSEEILKIIKEEERNRKNVDNTHI